MAFLTSLQKLQKGRTLIPFVGDCLSLGIIGDDVGKNLEGLSSGLPKFDLPAFEAGLPTFDVPLLQEVKNEFTSFSTPVAELKVELPKLPPLQNIQMPTLEDVEVLTNLLLTAQIKRTTNEARKALASDLSHEWGSVVPSLDEIKKEAGDLSSDLGLAMELNFKDLLGPPSSIFLSNLTQEIH